MADRPEELQGDARCLPGELSVVSCRNGSMNLATWAERNRVARVTAYRWFRASLLPITRVVVEVGSAFNGHRRKFLALLRDPTVHRIVVKHAQAA